jgi:4-amino-4-deoxy-L-arabinose transferase-like glycosyltransferase
MMRSRGEPCRGPWGCSRERIRTSDEVLPLVAIAVWFAGGALLVAPHSEVPILDDWIYAWSVEHLLESGKLEVLPFSSVYPILQILVGAIVSIPFGFSFALLRLCTEGMAFGGTCAAYLTLRELGFERRRALLGTLAVATNPAVLLLTHSFMTDVPLLALSSVALLLYVRAWARRRPGLLWAASAISAAGILIRQVGIALPVSAVLVAAVTRDPWVQKASRWPAFAGVATALCLWLGVRVALGETSDEAERIAQLRYLFRFPLRSYVHAMLETGLAVSFMLVPLALAAIRIRPFRWAAAVAAVAGACFVLEWLANGGAPFNPLRPEAVWSLHELGQARRLMHGSLMTSEGGGVATVAQALMFCSFGVILAAAARSARRTSVAGREHTGFGLLAAFALCYLGLIHVLWLFNERYYLQLLPAAIPFCLRWLDEPQFSTRIAAALLAAQGAIGIAGTRDALRFNELCRTEYAALLHEGVSAYDIDAGYSLNGWMLYAHSENLPAGIDRRTGVPFVTSKGMRPYVLSTSGLEGYDVLQRVESQGWFWPAPWELYVLRKRPASEEPFEPVRSEPTPDSACGRSPHQLLERPDSCAFLNPSRKPRGRSFAQARRSHPASGTSRVLRAFGASAEGMLPQGARQFSFGRNRERASSARRAVQRHPGLLRGATSGLFSSGGESESRTRTILPRVVLLAAPRRVAQCVREDFPMARVGESAGELASSSGRSTIST